MLLSNLLCSEVQTQLHSCVNSTRGTWRFMSLTHPTTCHIQASIVSNATLTVTQQLNIDTIDSAWKSLSDKYPGLRTTKYSARQIMGSKSFEVFDLYQQLSGNARVRARPTLVNISGSRLFVISHMKDRWHSYEYCVF